MVQLTESSHHTGDFIISEAHGNRSRDNAVLAMGQVVVAGQVVSRLTSGGKITKYDNAGGSGSEAAVGISLSNYDATDADVPMVIIARDAEVIGWQLVWGDGGSPAGDLAAGIADLEAKHIMVRY